MSTATDSAGSSRDVMSVDGAPVSRLDDTPGPTDGGTEGTLPPPPPDAAALLPPPPVDSTSDVGVDSTSPPPPLPPLPTDSGTAIDPQPDPVARPSQGLKDEPATPATITPTATSNSSNNIGQGDGKVKYILLAEFDIDKGSVLRHQYPQPTGIDGSHLAEQMLPDGAHNHAQDWTLFFLNRGLQHDTLPPRPATHVPGRPVKAAVFTYGVAEQDWLSLGAPTATHTLHFLCDKEGKTEEEYRHNPYNRRIEIRDSKGEVVLGFQVHAALQHAVLRPLFSSVYTKEEKAIGVLFDDASAEREFIAQVDGHVTALAEDVEAMSTLPRNGASGGGGSSDGRELNSDDYDVGGNFLHCLNLVLTKKDASVKRGAIVKALAVCTEQPYVKVFKPVILLALEEYFTTQSIDTLKELYQALNGVNTSKVDNSSVHYRRAARVSGLPSIPKEDVQECTFAGVPMKLRLPLTLSDSDVGNGSVVNLIRKFDSGVMVILNAILYEKRVLFLGYNHPAGEVGAHVLAACMLVSPPLRDVLRRRVFPYANLANIKFLEVRGYIAGVTNPMFEQRGEWWDYLCDIDTGKVTRNTTTQPSKHKDEAYYDADMELFNTALNGVNSHLSEEWVRECFAHYVQSLMDMAFQEEVFPDDATRFAVLECNTTRVFRWKNTRAYLEQRQILTQLGWRENGQSLSSYVPVGNILKRLAVRKNIGEEEFLTILSTLTRYVCTEERLYELLGHLPEDQEGIFPLAVGLFHTAQRTRNSTRDFLRHLDTFKEGLHVLSQLNFFSVLAYERNAKAVFL